MIATPAVTPEKAMAFVLSRVWNEEAVASHANVSFHDMTCRRAGRQWGMDAFACRARILTRAGRSYHVRFVVTNDGTPTAWRREQSVGRTRCWRHAANVRMCYTTGAVCRLVFYITRGGIVDHFGGKVPCKPRRQS